jgi:hypothetical protein
MLWERKMEMSTGLYGPNRAAVLVSFFAIRLAGVDLIGRTLLYPFSNDIGPRPEV